MPTATCAALLLQHINNLEARVVLGEKREPPLSSEPMDPGLQGAAKPRSGSVEPGTAKPGKYIP